MDASLRDELVEARETIRAQLDRLSLGHSVSLPAPDTRDVAAELKRELQEIEKLLGADERNETE